MMVEAGWPINQFESMHYEPYRGKVDIVMPVTGRFA